MTPLNDTRLNVTAHLFSLLFVVSTASASDIGARTKATLDTEAFSVKYPRSWQIIRDEDVPECMLFNSTAKKKFEPFTLRICLRDGPPFDVATDMGFFLKSGTWTIAGSMDMAKATISKPTGRLTLEGKVSCGVTDQAGFHAAGGICFKAVLLGAARSLTFESSGLATNFEEMKAVVKSALLVEPNCAISKVEYTD